MKARLRAVIGYASATALGAADLEIRTVVVGLTPADIATDPRIKVVRELGGGRTLIARPAIRRTRISWWGWPAAAATSRRSPETTES